MSLSVCLISILLLVPIALSLPTDIERPTTQTPQCELYLQELTSNVIEGVFVANDTLEIRFRAILENGAIYSASSVVHASDPDTSMLVQLSFPHTEGRVVPEIEKHIFESAGQLVDSTTCEIPDHLNELFEEVADKLYRCTESMGMSQLRFSIMYHETIVASAKRICNGAETVCTASPKYVYGNGLFICQEDMEELFPEEMKEARRKMAEARKPKTDMSEARGKRLSAWCSLTGSCGVLEGGDWGCCGNYAGCCRLCHGVCLAHDAVCTCCLGDHWFCGPACQPDSWCNQTAHQ